jgi:hypothetical protein
MAFSAPPALATLDDIETAFRPLDDTERGGAEHLLRMAQALVRAEIPGVDIRLDAGQLDPDIVRDVVVSVTLRALRNPDNARGRSRTSGPFTEYVQFDAEMAQMTLLPLERRLLAAPMRRPPGLGTIRVTAGLGWPGGGGVPDTRDLRGTRGSW